MAALKVSKDRIFTSGIYILFAAAATAFSGYIAIAICFVIMQLVVVDATEALRRAGYKVLRPLVYGVSALMLPAFLLFRLSGVCIVLALGVTVTLCIAVFYRGRKFTDFIYSLFLFMYPLLPAGMFMFVTCIQNTEITRIYLLLLFLLPAASDTFALLGGMLFGKRKLCPDISPKKTVAGAIAAFVGGTIAGLATGLIVTGYFTDVIPLYQYVVMGFVSGFFSQVGDLSASMLKRFCGIKDFGSYLPGHGGMLDRFDSAIVVAVMLFIHMELILLK